MGALTGLKILDFSTLLPGPYATLMLADLGADVLSVAAPGRRDLVTEWQPIIDGTTTSAATAWLGRNKKTMFLDLKSDKGIAVVKKLITPVKQGGLGYDIILEQFRPGVMAKLGLDYNTLKTVNPQLIYCSLTGYGQMGNLSDRAGHDINYLARSGNMGHAGRKGTGPVLTDMQIADVAVGSMNSVVGILSAVIYRNNTGKGQTIDIAMLDGMIPFNTMDGISYLAGGASPQREAQLLNGGGIYDFYETADHRYLSVGSLEPKFFRNLCIAVNKPEWQDGAALKKDPDMVKQTLIAIFKTKTLHEWTTIFRQTDACVEPVLTIEEMSRDQHILDRAMLPDVPLPENERTVRQFGCPVKLSDCPAEYKHAGYPVGHHTAEMLEQCGFEG